MHTEEDAAIQLLQETAQANRREPRWVRTRKCGCGNCNFYPASVRGDCHMKDHPDAKWLWATNPRRGSDLRDIVGE